MAIFVDEDLTASPNPTTLPKRVEFQQTLHSSRPSEAVRIAYSLSQAHNVWFEDTDGQLQKQVVREETIGSTPQVTVDRITMTTGPGVGGMLTVEVSQAIIDAQNNVIPGLVIVQIQS